LLGWPVAPKPWREARPDRLRPRDSSIWQVWAFKAKLRLQFTDVGLMIEGVGSGRLSQRVRADLEARGISSYQPVDQVGIERLVGPAGAVVPDWPEKRAGVVRSVAGGLEVIVDQFVGSGMQRQISDLFSLA
jgi:hypothetical protein